MMRGPFKRRAVRGWSKLVWAGLLRASGLLGLARTWVRRQGVLVLTFHRVLTPEELTLTSSLAGMIVRASTFDRFLGYAARYCRIIDLREEPEWTVSEKLKVAITFDDGWSDNASNAFPVARKHGVPFTIFIVPGRAGEAVPFWPEQAAAVMNLHSNREQSVESVIESLKSMPARERNLRLDRMTAPAALAISTPVDTTMSWEQIAELKACGVVFGSHTSTHEILTSLEPAQAEKEIVESRRQVEERLHTLCSLFSYPNGNCSREVRDMVARAGYRHAFLNQTPGVWTAGSDRLQIPRVNVCEYHLVNAKGEFSPLIFDYAVVWKAACALLSETLSIYSTKMTRRWRSLRAERGMQTS